VGTVIMHNAVSVDGFIADENDDVGPLHDWYFSGDTPITEGGDQQFDHSGTGSRFRESRPRATTWSWSPAGPSRRAGIPRRRTTSPAT
jgi:hypothetical protein